MGLAEESCRVGVFGGLFVVARRSASLRSASLLRRLDFSTASFTPRLRLVRSISLRFVNSPHMGIHDLFGTLRKKCPDVIHHMSQSNLKGISVAVDISIFFNTVIRSADPNSQIANGWLSGFVDFLINFKRNNISPIFIFDGLEVPDEKREEQQRRRDVVNRAKDNLAKGQELLPLIEKYRDQGVLPPEDIISSLREVIGPNRAKALETDFSDIYSIAPSLAFAIRKIEKQTLPILPQYTTIARDFIEVLGFDHYLAKGEAEALCASMCIEGSVDAVVTEDGDVFAYGCPYLLCKWTRGQCDAIALDEILEGLGLDFPTFRDFCIMSGCDYNHRAKLPPNPKAKPNKKGEPPKPRPVGPTGALKLLEEFGSLDVIEAELWNPEVLNFRRCRELFQPPDTSFLASPAPRGLDRKRLGVLWKKYTLKEAQMNRIIKLWSPKDVVIDDTGVEF